MCKHDQKECPRCGGAFECKVGSILLCQCTSVKLTTAEMDYIKEQHTDCLCAACLLLLKNEYQQKLLQQRIEKISTLFCSGESK